MTRDVTGDGERAYPMKIFNRRRQGISPGRNPDDMPCLNALLYSLCRKPTVYQFRLSVTPSLGFLMAACAAASRAMGTRKGEQET